MPSGQTHSPTFIARAQTLKPLVDCLAMLGSVLVIEDRATNDFDIGNIVLRRLVDEQEEAARVGSSVFWVKRSLRNLVVMMLV